MQIAALPLEKRAEAFSMCQETLRESAERMGIAGLQMEGLYEPSNGSHSSQQNIDVSGSPQGGKA